MNRIPLIVVVGPTASGKTALGVELSKHYGGEVISADSMQIYKGMSIATAKPDEAEMQGIAHRLIDFAEPGCDFSVAQYVRLANAEIDAVIANGRQPVVVGGTGLYINSLIDNIRFDDTSCDEEFREKMNDVAKEKGNHYLWEMLFKVDEKTALKVHENNLTRVIRALEVYKNSGTRLSDQKAASRSEPSRFDAAVIGLTFSDREKLYDRINARVDRMISDGLVDEARDFYYKYRDTLKTAHQAIGFKELIPYFKNEKKLDECVETIKQETRRYAKRQLTWFRRDDRIFWIEIDKCNGADEILNLSIKHIAKTIKV